MASCAVYAFTIGVVGRTGLPSAAWVSGSWVQIAERIGGRGLGFALLCTTMVSMFGAFNSLTMSYSRLPPAMAEAGYAPRTLLRRLPNGSPWVALIVCGIAWSAALSVSFERLLLLDILLYGASLMLEFLALVLLRVREPELHRPFVVPGGKAGAVLLGIGPAVLLSVAGLKSYNEKIGNVSVFVVGLGLMAIGVGLYFVVRPKPSL